MEKVVYHGRRGGLSTEQGRPIFFTDSREDAEWYAHERGDFSKEPTITAATIDLVRPASFDDLINAIKVTGATEKDIQDNSPYQGHNQIDFLYVPKVIDDLKQKGFDGFQGWDVLTNTEIPITVIFSQDQIKRIEHQKF